MDSFNYFPGQLATIFLETLDGYGVRANSPSTPTVNRIIVPGFNLAPNYPQNMSQFDTGLYYFQFNIPVGAISIGSYLVDVEYIRPSDGISVNKTYQIICTSPFGNYSATPT